MVLLLRSRHGKLFSSQGCLPIEWSKLIQPMSNCTGSSASVDSTNKISLSILENRQIVRDSISKEIIKINDVTQKRPKKRQASHELPSQLWGKTGLWDRSFKEGERRTEEHYKTWMKKQQRWVEPIKQYSQTIRGKTRSLRNSKQDIKIKKHELLQV